MKGENLVHLKFDYPEALNGKKDILYAERDFVNLMGTIRRYGHFRTEELKTKSNVLKLMKELMLKIKGFQNTLPKFDSDKILGKNQESKEEIHKENSNNKIETEKQKEVKPHDDIEAQLMDIQKRLGEISG